VCDVCIMHQGDGNVYKILVGKHEGKEPLGKPLDIWNDYIRNGALGNRL